MATRRKVTQTTEETTTPLVSRKDFINSVIKKKQKNKFLSEHPDRQECYIHSISTLIGEGVITYDIDRDKDNAKSISFDNPTVGLSFSEDETHRFEEASGRFSNLFPKALEFITEVDEDFSVTDIINQEGLSNFASVHSSVYKPN